MKNKPVVIIASILVLALVAFSVKSMLSDKSSTQTPTAGVTPAQDGEIFLSWGKFNYNPEVITVKKGESVSIRGDLKRLTGCFRTFRIPEFGVSHQFRTGNEVVEFTPEKTGTFTFTCGMGMGKGTLVVR